MIPPKLTVIIATRNAATVLDHCLGSIQRLLSADIEVIIKDALSTDATLDVCSKYQKIIPLMRVFSQKDSGIYDAWNQALAHASGEWVLFLGADDYLMPPFFFSELLYALSRVPACSSYVASPVALVDDFGRMLDTLLPSRNLKRDLPEGMPLPHQGLFHRRSLFDSARFDASLQIVGDYDFICRTLKPEAVEYLDQPYVCMALGGISGNLRGMFARNSEALHVSRRHFPNAARPALWKRLILSRVFLMAASVFGDATGAALADMYRAVCGKNRVWVKRRNMLKTTSTTTTGQITHTPSTASEAAHAGGWPLPQSPHLSLLIATVNRTTPLRFLFESLAAQTCRDFEVLLADQNPPDLLRELIAEYSSRFPLKVFSTPPQGVSLARNILLPHATGEVIAFPDDDCFYAPDTVERVLEIFRQYPHLGGLLGKWSAPEATKAARENIHDTPPLPAVTRFSAFRQAGTLVQFYRREAVDAVGGFDPVLGPGTGLPYGCGEDTDYLLRVLEAGYTVSRTAAVRVFHPAPDMIKLDGPKIHAYAQGRMYILRKHSFPWWFKAANVLYPLAALPTDVFKHGPAAARYRWAMFTGRLSGLFQSKNTKK